MDNIRCYMCKKCGGYNNDFCVDDGSLIEDADDIHDCEAYEEN